MQDVTPWPESFDVSQPVARVLVDGQEVDVESVTVTSELDSAMPERVAAGGGGVVAATGSASILRADEATEAGFNPWGDAQQFVNASEVVVEAGYRDPETGGVGCARQLTSQVESLDGGASSNTVGLEFVDYTPVLDRDITIEPLLEHYPPLYDEHRRRGAGLYPLYITDRVLRHCGFYATPPMVSRAIISAPMMGSLIPEKGTLESAEAYSNKDVSALFGQTPWGMGVRDGRAWFLPDYGSRGHGRLTSTLHVSFHLDYPNQSSADAVIEMRWGSSDDGIHIIPLGNGNLSVRFIRNGVITTVASLRDIDDAEAFTVLIDPAGHVNIHTSTGESASGWGMVPNLFRNNDLSSVYVRALDRSAVLGGVQVAFTDTTNQDFQRTAHLDSPAYSHSLQAFPARINANCLSLLKEQAEAELAAMWIDEFGHFRWRNRHNLRGSTPRGTLTSKDDLFDVTWQNPVRSVFSRVEVEHDIPTVTRRTFASITVSDNRGSTLSNEDTEDRFFEPPTDQDWHSVESPQWMGSTVNYRELRRGRGSYHGGIVVDDDDNERLAYSSRLHQVWSQINPQRWLLHSEAHSLEDDEYIEQSLRDRRDLYGRFAEENLPIIRARGLVEWDQGTTIGSSRGPVLAPVLTHTVGPWIQATSELRSLANWLAEPLTKPDVILRRIPIVPDPRIQLGDVFWLEDQAAYHIRARVVVMGKTLTYQATNSGYAMSQEITCQVLDVERLGVRYDELEAAWSERDYSAFTSAWSGQDYDALEANPLNRS